MSYSDAVTPSNVPNSLPIPRDSNMRKNIMDQNGADGPNSLMACVNTTKANPVPSAACQ